MTRGYIGVEAQELNGATAKALDLADQSGALLAGVQPDGPASHAGLQPGDVIRSGERQEGRQPARARGATSPPSSRVTRRI